MSHVQTSCYKCKCAFWLPSALHEAARAEESISFFCPYGHKQHFAQGETEETKLRRECNMLKQQIARVEGERIDALATANDQLGRALKAEASVKRLKRRSAAGTCPCCSRSFANMARHMNHEHPDWVKERGNG